MREPAFGAAPTGNVLYWTRERVLLGLRDFMAVHPKGQLPCSDDLYNALKKGNPSWPRASRVLEEFGSMARGWLAAGAPPARITLHNIDWNADEDEYLLENAGRMSLAAIARRLHRSYGSVRSRLNRTHGKRAREVQCYLSAAQVAAQFNVPYHRVQELCRTGRLKAKKRLGTWQIDARDCVGHAQLNAPKRTYRKIAPDVGDYYRRYGIRRRMGADGKLERYEAAS